jgi:hypothetical protein
MVHVGLDLSRTRLDVHVMDEAGAALAVTTAAPDRDGLTVLTDRIGGFGGPAYAAIESMKGARCVHDQLELAGWQVEIADAQACKTDKIDAWVLAELSRRDLVPAIWLPTPTVRAEREQARWRLHLVRPSHPTWSSPRGGDREMSAAPLHPARPPPDRLPICPFPGALIVPPVPRTSRSSSSPLRGCGCSTWTRSSPTAVHIPPSNHEKKTS